MDEQAVVTSKRADELRKGDVLELKGDRWVVLKAKVKGKIVHLTIDGRRGSFTDDVRAKDRYTVVDAPPLSTSEPSSNRRGGRTPETQPLDGPLIDARGAQTRWATEAEQARETQPPAESGKSYPWDAVPKSDRPLIDQLGAKLIGVEVEGGKLIVPPVTDTTILGHLATMHGVRYDGVTIMEAKAWAKSNDPGGDVTAQQVLDALTLERAHELHTGLHVDFASIPKPHWHRERAPR